MRSLVRTGLFAAALALWTPLLAQGAVLTSDTLANAGRYGFDQDLGPYFGTGPKVRSIGTNAFTWTSSHIHSNFDYDGGYGLGENGTWTAGRNGYAGLNTEAGSMSFTFDRAVAGVGGLLNYAPPASFFGEAILTVYGARDVLLETFNVSQDAPISTPGGTDAGAFRGFSRDQADIYRFELSNGYVVIDDLVIGQPAPVPLPATIPLLALGLGALGYTVRRRDRK